MYTIEELKKMGYDVKVYHSHNKNQPKGGETKVSLKLPGYSWKNAIGHSVCSNKDNFNRKLGTRIALGRALKELGMETK